MVACPFVAPSIAMFVINNERLDNCLQHTDNCRLTEIHIFTQQTIG